MDTLGDAGHWLSAAKIDGSRLRKAIEVELENLEIFKAIRYYSIILVRAKLHVSYAQQQTRHLSQNYNRVKEDTEYIALI